MAGEAAADMSGWSDLLHSSTKLLEQAAPSSHFPPLQRNLDQLESLSKKLKAKTLRSEAPKQSVAATRLLAREGIDAEQLSRDLKSFELKTTFEDVFPTEATSVEEYLQQVHEMTMISAVQEAQKDNLRRFNDYMMHVIEEDWHKEKREFLQSMNRLSTVQKTSSPAVVTTPVGLKVASLTSNAQVSANQSSMELVPVSDKNVQERKASIYADVVRSLNDARTRGLPFNTATSFKSAYEGLNLDSSGSKSVSMQKIWHLIQVFLGEIGAKTPNVSSRMSLVIGARRHLEWGHEKFILDTIQSHPAQAALGGVVGNLQRVRAFLRVRLRDYGVLDFDAGDTIRQPPVDTTWQQIYFCLRTGYYDEARQVAQSSRVSLQFAPLLAEWITTGGLVSPETSASASEECDRMLRVGDRAGRIGYDKKKLVLYAMISGSHRQIDRLLRDLPNLFTTIEDFLWFKLSAIRDNPGRPSSAILNESTVPYTLEDLQVYLNKFEPSYYTKNGKDLLVYPYVLLLSIQMLPAVLYLSKELGEDGYYIDAVHISIALADHGVLSEDSKVRQNLRTMDAFAEVANIIRQYGSLYLRQGNLPLALEYFAQAAAAIGGGRLSWVGRGNVEHQRQRNLMLTQLLTELLLHDGGVALLLGPRGCGEEGTLQRFFPTGVSQRKFLLEAAQRCQESGLHEKSIELYKRVGAFGMALETVNNCLSEAICALFRGRLDGDSRAVSLIHVGNDVMEAYKYTPESSFPERDRISEQQFVLRQLEAILFIYKLARTGRHADAVREVSKLPFLPLDPRSPDITANTLQNVSPEVEACLPDLLKLALTCLDSVKDTDGTLRTLRGKIANFVASNMSRNWPQDLYEKVARSV